MVLKKPLDHGPSRTMNHDPTIQGQPLGDERILEVRMEVSLTDLVCDYRILEGREKVSLTDFVCVVFLTFSLSLVKHFHSLMVSSAAALATVVPHGDMVRLSTLASCPTKHQTIQTLTNNGVNREHVSTSKSTPSLINKITAYMYQTNIV